MDDYKSTCALGLSPINNTPASVRNAEAACHPVAQHKETRFLMTVSIIARLQGHHETSDSNHAQCHAADRWDEGRCCCASCDEF
jgi:hypothetical protein